MTTKASHSESDSAAIVFSVQDAGLFLHMRTLDIQFAGGGPNDNF